MTEQNFIYECSRTNASHKVSNSEWINEWNEGIKLEKGDTVRLLGSFISESGSGQDVSVNQDTKFTIDFYPYLNADTVTFPDATHAGFTSNHQLQMGDIAQPAYMTDNFGIEPPYTANDFTSTPSNPDNITQRKRLIKDRFEFPQRSLHYTPYNFDPNDDAVKAGCYIDTTTGTISQAEADANAKIEGTLSMFNQTNLTQEFAVGHLSKLCNLPLFKGVTYDTGGGVFETQNFSYDEYLKVDDYISTYYCSQYPTQATPTATQYTYTTGIGQFGVPKWEAGPQSVVGRVQAVNFKFVQIYDPVSNISRALEINQAYVGDFINPGQYKFQNDMDGNARAPRHGASELKNRYNNLRNNNKTNGITLAQQPTGNLAADAQNDFNTFIPVCDDYQIAGNQDLVGENNIQKNMKGLTNMGLSFLWSCGGSYFHIDANGIGNFTNFPYQTTASWVKFNSNLQPSAPSFFYMAIANTIGTDTLIIGTNMAYSVTRLFDTINSKFTDSTTSFAAKLCVSYKPVPKQNTYANYEFYYELTLDTPIGVVIPVNDRLNYEREQGGWYWLPLQFSYFYTSGPSAVTFTEMPSNDWKEIGAIVQMNPDDDNNPYQVPPGFAKRLYIPFTEQSEVSPYNVRNFNNGTYTGGTGHVFFQNPITGDFTNSISQRKRYNFGVSCCYGGAGDTRIQARRTVPFPYYVDSPNIDYTSWKGAGKPNKNYWYAGGYNDQVLSMYFQTEAGDCKVLADTAPYTNNTLWKTDLIYRKQYKSEYTVPAGFYEDNRLADLINDLLHLNDQDYKEKEGINTNVGSREKALTDGNNVIYGNFIHTYIPDLTYGFMPLVTGTTNEKFPTVRFENLNNYFFTRNDDGTETIINNGYEYYTLPFNQTAGGVDIANDGTTVCFRLIGSRTLQTQKGNSMTYINPSQVLNNRLYDFIYQNFDTRALPDHQYFSYQSRGFKNRLMYGGCAKCWVGAVNPTFSFDNEKNLYSFSFLYTPYRPATAEDGTTINMISGEAVPSAIINAQGSGGITDSLSGIYIRSLTGSQIDATNTPSLFDLFPNNTYPTTIPDYDAKEVAFWNTLGFSTALLSSFSNNYPVDPYIYYERGLSRKTILRNQAEVDIAVNGSNPIKSYCSLWCPPLQYAVIVNSNFVYGDSRPKVSSSPFYLIGSSFPSKYYYGGKGTKLPIMAICSRQFTSFGFSFDLSESAVQFTVEEDQTITSIHTKIYNNDYTIPQNLDENSSIIYVLTKNNYAPDPTPEEIEQGAIAIAEQNLPLQYTPDMFTMIPQEYTYQAPLYLKDEFDTDSDLD